MSGKCKIEFKGHTHIVDLMHSKRQPFFAECCKFKTYILNIESFTTNKTSKVCISTDLPDVSCKNCFGTDTSDGKERLALRVTF